jgi:hypothetical protein
MINRSKITLFLEMSKKNKGQHCINVTPLSILTLFSAFLTQ